MPPPPLPFPYPLRIGTDICRVARIAHILRSRQGARFIRRVLAPEELARARPAVHQVLRAAAAAQQTGGDGEAALDAYAYARAATYVAGRFAAKEAAFKAHPHLRLGFHDILILSSSDAEELTGERALAGPGASAPVALIRAGEKGAGARDQMARVSISHDGEYATATCIGFEAGSAGSGQCTSEPPRKGWAAWFSRIWS
ncbi:uncharacterized protein P884DRAFT_244503 [Thermothelomyces heterothallicus CBS 202.75]|uniref:uncharacterized protein n=1 Tax=Thermothelomyces heterothallicus CBS 202.75 TaxID=1149848 RepID=UPI0037445214